MPWVKMPFQDQWSNALDENAAGFVVKTYLPGTTTATPMAIDKNGSTTVATATLNADGLPEVSGNEVTLYIDREFKFALFENASDAAANSNPYYGFIDNVKIDPFSSGLVQDPVSDYAELRALTSSGIPDGAVIPVTNDGIAGQFVVKTGTVTDNGGTLIVFTDDSNRYAERGYSGAVNVKWFGAKGDGSTDDKADIDAAIAFVGGLTTGQPPELFFPSGRYMVSDRIEANNYNRLSIIGEGWGSQLYPSSTGYGTLLMGFNNININLKKMHVFVNDNQVAIDWEGHQGQIENNIVTPISTTSATGITCIRLNQTASNTGSWITDVSFNYIDFGDLNSTTSTNNIGFNLVGASNRVNVVFNTIAGANGVGCKIEEFGGGTHFSQSVLVMGNDFESMANTSETNYGIEVTGYSQRISVKNNYFEGIYGTNSRFAKVGMTANVLGFVFEENHCLTANPLPTGFKGIELDNVISPCISGNYYGVPGSGDLSVTSNTVMGLANQLDSPPIFIYDLLNEEQASSQIVAIADTYENVSTSRTYTPMHSFLPQLAKLEIVYEPALALTAPNVYSFAIQADGGSIYTDSVTTESPSTTSVRKISSDLFYAGINDLQPLVAKATTQGSGEGFKILSARLLIYGS